MSARRFSPRLDPAPADAPAAQVGRMAARIRAFDWSKHPLGSPERWPQSLRTAVQVMLASRFQMWLGWGSEVYFFYNDAYAPTLGLRDEHALGMPCAQLWPEIMPELQSRFASVLEHGEATWDVALFLLLERNGYPEETYHTFSYSPVPDDAGGIGGLLCVVTEETVRVIGERRMRLLRELAAALAGSNTEAEMFDAFIRRAAAHGHDLPFALVYLFDESAAQARLAASIGVSGFDALAPATIAVADPRATWPAAALLASGEPVVLDLARFSAVPSGPWKQPPRQAVLVPLAQQGQERPAGFLVVGLNPCRPFDTEYRGFLGLLAGQIASGLGNARAYQAERQRAEALAQLDRAKTAFFNNVSHELRTPLTLMLGPLADIARTPDGAAAEARELAALAHRNARRLLRLVNTLLDFSRIEAGRSHTARVPTDLATFTVEIASTFRSTIERAGLVFTVDCPPLPEPVAVDREAWEKIVLNLLSNAFKFTLAGTIRVTLRAEADRVRLDVTDTGTGIPAEAQRRLFERFYRVEGSSGRTQEGTGIGLALVQELVKLQGGRIEFESEYGRGSRFSVLLPRSPAPAGAGLPLRGNDAASVEAQPFIEEAARWTLEEPAAAITAGDADDDAPPGAARPHVLLAEDNADLRGYISRLLGQRYRVTAVEDGEAAWQSVQRERPDLVLSDVMMPRRDGFGLVQAIRGDPALHTLPVILLSARAGEEELVEGVGHGADDYLVKPFGARELTARIGTHLELARVRRNALAQLRASEARLRNALEIGDIGTWELELPAGQLVWSEKTHEIFGVRPGAFTPTLENARAFIHPEDRERAAAGLQRTVESGERCTTEFRIVRPDGEVRWLLSQRRTVPGENGEPGHVLGALLDITPQRQAAQQLREAQARLQATLAGAEVSTWQWDTVADTLLADAGMRRLFSVAARDGEPVPVATFLTAIHPEDLPRVRARLEKAKSQSGTFEEDYRVVQPDGSWRWVVARTKTPDSDDAGLRRISGVLIDITDRKRTEEALRQREEQISILINYSPAGVYLVDSKLRLVQFNPKAAPVFAGIPGAIGRDLGEILRILWPADVAAELMAQFRHTLATGEAHFGTGFSSERRDIPREEQYDWELHRVALPDGEYGVVVYFMDISAHVQAQREIRETAERLELALAAAQLGLWSWEAGAGTVDVSERAARILGLPPGPAALGTLRSLVHPDDVPRVRDALRQAAQAREDYALECRFTPAGAAEHWAALHGRPIYAPDGRVSGMVGVVQDVTERKNAELQLRNQKEALQQIVRDVPLPEILDALTTWMEPFADRRLVPVIMLAAAGGALRFGAGARCPAKLRRELESLPAGAAKGDYHALARRHGLRGCSSTPILSSDGGLLGMFDLYYPAHEQPTAHEQQIVDLITRTAAIAIERQQAQAALLASRNKLEEHAQLLEQRVAERTARLRETVGELEAFSYSVSHDMRAPLRSMQGYAELVLREYGPQLDSAGQHYLQRISRNAERLELLVRDVLAYSKVAKEEVRLEPVDLDTFLPALVAQIAESQPPGLRISVQHPLPVAYAHEAYLSQILTNLIGNAVKFTAPGVAPEIHLSAERHGDEVKVFVRDNGIGIDPAHFSRIFEIFGRVHPDKQFDGTGIGLSIVKKAAQRMGGTVGVESALAKGSCFWFTLRHA